MVLNKTDRIMMKGEAIELNCATMIKNIKNNAIEKAVFKKAVSSLCCCCSRRWLLDEHCRRQASLQTRHVVFAEGSAEQDKFAPSGIQDSSRGVSCYIKS